MTRSNVADNLPMIGENVVWYQAGDTNSDPFVCTVTSIDGQGGLHLAVVPPRGGVLYGFAAYKDNIFHIDDPELLERPSVLREKGAWDTLKNHDMRRREKIAKARSKAQAMAKESIRAATPIDPESKLREQVMNLHKAGKKPEDIAAITQTKKTRVEEIIKSAMNAVAN